MSESPLARYLARCELSAGVEADGRHPRRVVVPPCFGFRVSGFGFRVPGFGFQVSGSGFRVSGFGFRFSVFGFGVWS